jgi:hypothetical protein
MNGRWSLMDGWAWFDQKWVFKWKWKLMDECCENRWDGLSWIKLTHKNEMKSNGWMWLYLM